MHMYPILNNTLFQTREGAQTQAGSTQWERESNTKLAVYSSGGREALIFLRKLIIFFFTFRIDFPKVSLIGILGGDARTLNTHPSYHSLPDTIINYCLYSQHYDATGIDLVQGGDGRGRVPNSFGKDYWIVTA